ncbi:unnamed protein product [Lepeophtheirus salmonis]|uniref:(salmon louse) hypothetical protein n=1 Tax=Lepeophtheirus salmonis TaxID=72036 RepID=A0A7R8GZH1_LEPSM|nr:unnamed protein product [Lepeophtheirus salmonis]CAF2764444.1 unnamed protein product [Lepeophtheirus salmonis]
MQVVFAHDLSHQWKQPIYLAFDEPMKEEILFQCISGIEQQGGKEIKTLSDIHQQRQFFPVQYKSDKSGKSLPSKDSICSLDPVLDDNQEIMCVVNYQHIKLFYASSSTVLAPLRSHFWIIKASSLDLSPDTRISTYISLFITSRIRLEKTKPSGIPLNASNAGMCGA